MAWHWPTSVRSADVARVSDVLNVGNGARTLMLSCESLPPIRERSHVRLSSARAAWYLTCVCASAFLIVAPAILAAEGQFTPFRSNDHRVILEGNWQSCREFDGRYSERIYDHVVNGDGKFEVHMGPYREFALFKDVSGRASRARLAGQFAEAVSRHARRRPREAALGDPVAQSGAHGHARRRLADGLRELVHSSRAARENLLLTLVWRVSDAPIGVRYAGSAEPICPHDPIVSLPQRHSRS